MTFKWVELGKKIQVELEWLREHPKHPERVSRIIEVNILIDQYNSVVPNTSQALPKVTRDYGREPSSPAASNEEQPGPRFRPMRDWVTEAMNEAIERGEFDNLPGKGKPLQLATSDPYGGLEAEVYGYVKRAGFIPEWVELRKKIAGEISSLREPTYQGNRTGKIDEINRLIERHNKLVPNPSLAFPKVPQDFA